MRAECRNRAAILALMLLFSMVGIFTLALMRSAAAEGSLPPSAVTPEPVQEDDPELTPEPTSEPTPEPTPEASPDPTPKLSPETTSEPTPDPTPEPTPEPTPKPRKRTELLTLVNPWHPMKEGYEPELKQVTWGYEEEQFMDVRAADDLMRMVSDCIEAGNVPYLCSAYRTQEKQQYLFNNKLYRLVYEDGVDPAEAPKIAAESVAVPGTSEHQLGLAADIIDYNYPYLNTEQENRPTQKWLMEHCWEYGFILRYPSDKSEITGIIYEPWHYRYVGREIAEEIRSLDLTLEEFLDLYYEPLE